MNKSGVLRTDFQTAQLTPWAQKSDTAITRKHFLADADFVAGLEGEENLLSVIHQALKNPIYPLSLGRKSFPPGQPVWIPEGLRQESLLEALRWEGPKQPCEPNALGWPEPNKNEREKGHQKLRVVLDSSEFGQGSLRRDVPVAAFSERKFGPRYVIYTSVERSLPCTSPSSV